MVGRTQNAAGDLSRYFLWDKVNGTRYLDTMLSSPYLDTLQITDINDAGVMTGQVRYDYNDHAVLIAPVPEPAALAALGLGLAGFLRRRRAR